MYFWPTSLIITVTARPVMGRAARCWPPWHCPHLAGLHFIYKWHFPPQFFSASFGHCISHCGASRVSWHELCFASLQLYLFCALAETTPSNTNLVSLPVIPGIIFARCARVSICSPNVIGIFFFSPHCHFSFTCLQTLLCTQCLLGPTVSRAAPLFSAAQDQALRVSTGGRAYRQPDLQWPTLLPALPCHSNLNLCFILNMTFSPYTCHALIMSA